MPFYDRLPSPTDVQPGQPIRDLAGGMAMGQGMVGGAMDLQGKALALEQAKRQVPVQQVEQQAQLLNAAAQYWDLTKTGLTKETYPKWREDTMRMFPMIPQTQFPPPEQFKTDQDFEQFKYQKEMMAAKFKNMMTAHSVAPGGSLVQGGAEVFRNPNKPMSVGAGGLYDPESGQLVVPPKPEKPSYEWFGNPDNPKEGGWVEKGKAPPNPNWVPKSQTVVIGKEQQKTESQDDMAQSLIDNRMAPNLISKRGDYNTILTKAMKKDPNYNPAKQDLWWYGAKRRLAALSGSQQMRLETVGVRVDHTVDEVRELTNQLNGKERDINLVARQAPPNLGITGVGPLNKAKLEYYMKVRGNTPEGQLATRYITAVNDLKEQFAQAASGGYAPTEPAWNLANKQINENFGIQQMGASLDEVQKLVRINVNAGRDMRREAGMNPMGQYQSTEPPPPAARATYGGGGASGGAGLTPIGMANDGSGRVVYRDANGNMFAK